MNTIMPSIAVTWAADVAGLQGRAEALAEHLRVALQAPGTVSARYAIVVWVDRIGLLELGSRRAAPVCVEFGLGDRQGRRSPIGRDLLIRALGTPPGKLTVVDATAGLGRDSFQLARAGCRVTALERSPILAALVQDGFDRARAKNESRLRATIERLRLIRCDARDYLRTLAESERPDVVLLDPMYPPRGKTALAKKEMRICRALVGDDEDAGELLEIARRAALRRVLVKRHRHAAPLAGEPEVTFRGRVIRFDVYLTQKHP